MAYTTVNCHMSDDTDIDVGPLLGVPGMWVLKLDQDVTIFGTPDQLRAAALVIIDGLPAASTAEEVVA